MLTTEGENAPLNPPSGRPYRLVREIDSVTLSIARCDMVQCIYLPRLVGSPEGT